MYENLVKRLRMKAGIEDFPDSIWTEAADAIEERDKHALTLQHEMMAEAESHIVLVEKLNKQIEELQNKVAEWQKCRDLERLLCSAAEKQIPRWVSVKERLPEDWSQKIVFHSRGVSFAYYNGNAWHSSIGKSHTLRTVTHWMPLPEQPRRDNDV